MKTNKHPLGFWHKKGNNHLHTWKASKHFHYCGIPAPRINEGKCPYCGGEE